MTAREYEQLVRQLVGALKQSVPPLSHAVVCGGSSNRLPGASGFQHQIDVSLSYAGWLVLVECKYWRRSVGAEAVLVAASRLSDIQAAMPSTNVCATIVSKKRATRGAQLIAKRFGVSLDTVTSPTRYGVRLGKNVFVTAEDSITLSDSVTAEVVHEPEA
jgi:hypothetical protein